MGRAHGCLARGQLGGVFGTLSGGPHAAEETDDELHARLRVRPVRRRSGWC